MSEEWGPLLTFNVVIGNFAIAFFAALAWSSGHLIWLVLNDKPVPAWVFGFFDEKRIKQFTFRNVYINKGLGWFINIFWAWTKLFISPGGNVLPYRPIIGNVTLLDIGGVAFELIVFLVLINLIRWNTGTKKS